MTPKIQENKRKYQPEEQGTEEMHENTFKIYKLITTPLGKSKMVADLQWVFIVHVGRLDLTL